MRAGVNERVMDDQIATPRQGGEQRLVGGETRAEIERALGAKEAGGFASSASCSA